MSTTCLQEIFSSVQGEGPYVGCRQIFIRFAGCNWQCAYCDTPSEKMPGHFQVEKTPGNRDFTTYPNPVDPLEVAHICTNFMLPLHHSVSLTGGEPLLQIDFIQELLPNLKGTRRGIFLETNGTLPGELSRIVDDIDIISMDIKLETSTKIPTPWDLHREFLKVGVRREIYVKVVISADTRQEEIMQAVGMLCELSPDSILVLQPVSELFDGIVAPPVGRILRLQEQAMEKLRDVRVIPQTHRMMGQL